MRNRTWLAVVTGVAVAVIVIQIQNARSQERKAREALRSAAAAVEHGDTKKVTYAIAMVEGLAGDLLTEEYVRSLIKLYPGERPFGAVARSDSSSDDELDTSDSVPSDGRSRVWLTPVADEDWDRVLRINLHAHLQFTRTRRSQHSRSRRKRNVAANRKSHRAQNRSYHRADYFGPNAGRVRIPARDL